MCVEIMMCHKSQMISRRSPSTRPSRSWWLEACRWLTTENKKWIGELHRMYVSKMLTRIVWGSWMAIDAVEVVQALTNTDIAWFLPMLITRYITMSIHNASITTGCSRFGISECMPSAWLPPCSRTNLNTYAKHPGSERLLYFDSRFDRSRSSIYYRWSKPSLFVWRNPFEKTILLSADDTQFECKQSCIVIS